MKNGVKVALVVLFAVAAGATLALRGGRWAEYVATPEPPAVTAPDAQSAATQASALGKPRFLDLGSRLCVTCLEMAEVMDALRRSQGEKLQVDFIDVFKHPEAPGKYQIAVIPTQILYDAAGKEIFRHTGFFSHDDILKKVRELGVKLHRLS